MKKHIICLAAAIIILCGAVCADPVHLLVYSGAGLKKPMEEIKTSYESDHDVAIEYVYAGSAQLLAQIQLSGKGDVFIVGSEEVYKDAQMKNLAGTPELVAHHTPCIAVRKGNPKHILSLEDMAKPGITVILGDPKANAIGLSARKIIEKNKLSGITANTVAETATVNELVLQLAMGQADAAIVTKDSIVHSPKVGCIEIAPDKNIEQIIPVGILTCSNHKTEAESFAGFIASPAGKNMFRKNGFEPVN